MDMCVCIVTQGDGVGKKLQWYTLPALNNSPISLSQTLYVEYLCVHRKGTKQNLIHS